MASTPEETDGEKLKAFSYMKPQGIPECGAKRNWKVMAQQTCYADSPDMPVPFAGKGLTGMNAENEWCCGSSLSMTDLVLPSVSVY